MQAGAVQRSCYHPLVASLLSGLLGVLVATNQSSAASNLVYEKTGARIEVADMNDPVEREYQRVLALDDNAQSEVERWLADDEKLNAAGAGVQGATLKARIQQRLEPVEREYKSFLEKHPRHAKGRIAYGSYLGEIGREDEAADQYLKAREIDPTNTAAWNNLANYYGHNGPVTNAFACYQKAIELNPREPIYFQNFATTVYLFRRDATNYFAITEQQVFDKAMELYRQALALDPENFPLATDLAQTYYGIEPPRVKDAFAAWNHAMKLAREEVERDGVRIHLARWHRTAGDFQAVRRELGSVTNAVFQVAKERILKSLDTASARTNAVPTAAVEK
jgi:tetratricopeptide (TPR) repeat protein